MDWDAQPEIVKQAWGFVLQGWEIAEGWLMSPAAWSQFGLLMASFVLAWGLSRRLKPWLTRLLSPADEQQAFSPICGASC